MAEWYVINESTLKRIADTIRRINGTSKTYTPLDMDSEIENIMDAASYILVDEEGNELLATYVGADTTLTATENDIRKGAVAVTNDGLITGIKEIPAYHTLEGFKIIPSGARCTIAIPNYDYTKFQAILCLFNTTIDNSVAAEKVVINDNVYAVKSSVSESTVTVDDSIKSVDLGITNTSNKLMFIRYFTYKEIY